MATPITMSASTFAFRLHCVCISHHEALMRASLVEAAACLPAPLVYFHAASQRPAQLRTTTALCLSELPRCSGCACPLQNTASQTPSAVQIMLPSPMTTCMPWPLLASGACTLRSYSLCKCCYTPCQRLPPQPRSPFTFLTQLQISPGTC